MSGITIPQGGPSQSSAYVIRIKGHLDPKWANRFGNVIITLLENGNTKIYCPELDQAALHGLLTRIRDLNVTLLSVNALGTKNNNMHDANR